MKKCLFVFSLFALVMTGCKNDQKESKSDESQNEKQQMSIVQKKVGNTVLSGEFIYEADAAVLKGNNFIYGIVIDSMATELAKQVKPLKRDEFDMVPVVIQGEIKPNPNKDGWDKVVEITKIVRVSKSTSKPAIIIKGDKNKTKK